VTLPTKDYLTRRGSTCPPKGAAVSLKGAPRPEGVDLTCRWAARLIHTFWTTTDLPAHWAICGGCFSSANSSGVEAKLQFVP